MVVFLVVGHPSRRRIPAASNEPRGISGSEVVRGIRVPTGGDVIVGIDGTEVDSGEDLSSYLTQTRPGDTVTLTVLRDGERVQVEVELDERPPPGGKR